MIRNQMNNLRSLRRRPYHMKNLRSKRYMFRNPMDMWNNLPWCRMFRRRKHPDMIRNLFHM